MNKKIWTEDELKYLRDNFPSLGARCCAEHLNRSIRSVQVKASRLGLKTNNQKTWNEQDIDILVQNIESVSSLAELASILGRSTQAIEQKARSLGLRCARFFSVSEDNFIIENYPEGDILEIANKLNRSYNAIVKRASRLNVKRTKNTPSIGYLYIIKFIEYPELNLFKVGITNNPTRRFLEFKTKVEVCSLLSGTYEDVARLEKYLLSFIQPYKQNYFILTSGNTETYSC